MQSGCLIKEVKGSYRQQLQRLESEALVEPRAKKAKHDSDGPSKERQEVQLRDEIKVAKKMLSNSELLLFAKGMEAKFLSDIQSGQPF